jgi:hypothetical protein
LTIESHSSARQTTPRARIPFSLSRAISTAPATVANTSTQSVPPPTKMVIGSSSKSVSSGSCESFRHSSFCIRILDRAFPPSRQRLRRLSIAPPRNRAHPHRMGHLAGSESEAPNPHRSKLTRCRFLAEGRLSALGDWAVQSPGWSEKAELSVMQFSNEEPTRSVDLH